MQVPVLSEGMVDTVTVSSQQLQMLLEMQRLQQENETLREYKAKETSKASLQNFMKVFGTQKKKKSRTMSLGASGEGGCMMH